MTRRDIERLDDLAHHYLDTLHSVVAATVKDDVPTLVEAVKRLREAAET
jgi:uncharacterized protein with HEPN domain